MWYHSMLYTKFQLQIMVHKMRNGDDVHCINSQHLHLTYQSVEVYILHNISFIKYAYRNKPTAINLEKLLC